MAIIFSQNPLHYCESLDEAIEYLDNGYLGDEIVEGLNTAICIVDDYQIIKAMLERGANPNIGLSKPLHAHTDIKILELLIEFGADVNGADPCIKDDDGELPEDDLLDDEQGIKMREFLYQRVFKCLRPGERYFY